jgi:inosine/xanthosine triphosphatase
VIIYIGSTRPAKVEAVRDAVAAIAAVDARFSHAEFRPVDVADAAPPMPMSEAEIISGARARARAMLGRAAAHGMRPDLLIFCVGLEGGLDRLPPYEPGRGGVPQDAPAWAIKNWACVTDGRQWMDGGGGALVLPYAVVQEVLAGAELGEVVDRIAGAGTRSTRGVWGLLTRDLHGRRDAFRTAVISAFTPFFNPRFYVS